MAVAFMMFKELRRNGGETAATAKNRYLPPNIFSPFLAELEILKSFEAILFFFKKITPTFLQLTLIIFQISYYSTKKSHEFSANVRVIFFGKKKLGSNNLEMYKSARNGKKIGGIWRFSAVEAVSPPFLRSSLTNIIKATAIPKLTAVTFLAEFLH